jgi:threonine/homoserine/homoserine lactone efflux protein
MLDVYTFSMLLSIAMYALTTSITPGPNNIILLSSVLTFGYKRTIPLMVATTMSFPLMVVVVGLGMGAVFEQFPMFFSLLKVLGITYLCWMAYKIASDSGNIDTSGGDKNKPFTFLQAFVYPWLNVKAWFISISSVALFVTSVEDRFFQVAVVFCFFIMSTVITVNSWAFGGMILKRFISNARFVRVFNISMAVLLVASVLPFVFE